MKSISDLFIIVIMFVLGCLPALYLAVSFPAVILWKIYRKVTKKIPLTM